MGLHGHGVKEERRDEKKYKIRGHSIIGNATTLQVVD